MMLDGMRRMLHQPRRIACRRNVPHAQMLHTLTLAMEEYGGEME